MKIKYSVLIFLLLLSLFSFFSLFPPPVFAATEIFSDIINEEESATIDGIVYTAYGYNDYVGVRLSSNEYGSILIEAEGETATHGPYTYTLNSITQEGEIISFDVTVEKEEGEVSITKSASSSTGTIGDTLKITVTITNEAANTETVKYIENLPREVSRVGTPEITKGTSTSSQKSTTADIYWDGILYEGESVTIVYKVMLEDYPSDGTTITLNDAIMTYKDSSGSYNETVDSVTISLSSPVSVRFELLTDEADLKVNQEAEYTVTVTNNLPKTATISSFLLTIPTTLDISYIDTGLEYADEGYAWEGQLSASEAQSFDLIVIPRGAGTHEFTALVDYSSTSGTGSSSATKYLTIEAGDVVPEIKLSKTSYEGGEQIIVYYYVNNSDEDVSYSNVALKLSADPSDLFDTINYVASLPKKTKTLIKKQNFTAPYTDKEKKYTLTMTGDYGTSSFDTSETLTMNAATFTIPYDLQYTIDGQDEENTNVTLTVTLLTTLTEQPSKISIIHTADPEYKKTVTLTNDDVATLFNTGTYTRSWNIPAISFVTETVDLDVELEYFLSNGRYEHYFTQEIPIYHAAIEEEIVVEAEIVEQNVTQENITQETTEENATIQEADAALQEDEAAQEIEAESSANANITEENTVTITGQSEKSTKKWVWLLLIIFSLGAAAFSGHYFIMKKQKQAAMKRAIENISSKEVKEEKKESFFARAKEIIIQDIPSPEEGYDKLEGYMKHALSQGKTAEEIKKILLTKGWIDDIVESYLRRLK